MPSPRSAPAKEAAEATPPAPNTPRNKATTNPNIPKKNNIYGNQKQRKTPPPHPENNH